MTKRDAFRGPGYWNVDATLSKRIRFTDRYAVQFRFEAYNLLNHPNMYVDSANADISTSMRSTATRECVPTFSRPTCAD